MEAGGKDREEETLQTAFKKLRVDAESGDVSVSDTMAPRAASRVCLDSSGAKPKLGCPKDNWHGSLRKTSRGASRTQRRRRSKSPILHPPKFTYCSGATVLSPPGVCLKHQRLEPAESHPACDTAAQAELSSPGASGPVTPVVFGSAAGYEGHRRPSAGGPPAATEPGPDARSTESGTETGDGAESGAAAAVAPADDFRSLSKLHCSGADGPRPPCACDPPHSQEGGGECTCQVHRQGWNGVEVYAFTGLRDVISGCERSLPGQDDAPRTPSGAVPSSPSVLASGSPRSCSEQARGYVDDITIEDLSGYMEFYLYIPKKMSHMAEMMYT